MRIINRMPLSTVTFSQLNPGVVFRAKTIPDTLFIKCAGGDTLNAVDMDTGNMYAMVAADTVYVVEGAFVIGDKP